MSVASGKEELSDRLLLLSDVGLRFSKFVGFVKICKDVTCANITFIGLLGVLSYRNATWVRDEPEAHVLV